LPLWLTAAGRRSEQGLPALKRLGWTTLGLAGSGSTALVFNVVMARVVSHAQFGHIARTYAAAMIVAQITMAGVTPALTRVVAQASDERERMELARAASRRLVGLIAPLGVLYLIFGATGLAPGDALSLLLGCLIALVYPLYFGLKTLLFALSLIRTYTILECAADVAFFAVLGAFAVLAPRFSLLSFSLAYGGFSVVTYLLFRRSATVPRPIKVSRALVRFAALATVGSYATATQSLVVLLLTGVLGSSAEAGQLAAVLALTSPFALLPQAAGILSFVSAARPADGFEASLRQMVRLVATAVGCACCAAAAFAYPLVRLVLGQSYEKAVPSLLVLLVGVSAILGMTAIGNALAGAGRIGTTATISASGFLVAVVGAGILVPRFGSLGAAVAIAGALTSMSLALLRVGSHVHWIGILDVAPAFVLPAAGALLAHADIGTLVRGASMCLLVGAALASTAVQIKTASVER
jgi:O-antigen/teichoic acid export membrane protein